MHSEQAVNRQEVPGNGIGSAQALHLFGFIHTRAYRCVCSYIHIYIYAQQPIFIYVYIYCMFMLYVSIPIYTYTHICIMHMNIFIYICMYCTYRTPAQRLEEVIKQILEK